MKRLIPILALVALAACSTTGDNPTPVTTTAQAAQEVGRTQGQSVSFVFADQTLTFDIKMPEDVLENLSPEQKAARDQRLAKALGIIESAVPKFTDLGAGATAMERVAALQAMSEFAKGVGSATGSLVTIDMSEADISNSGDSAGLGGEGAPPPKEDEPEKPDGT